MIKLDLPQGPYKNLTAIDGPPGTGKTTEIVRRASEETQSTAIITYTNAAADIVASRIGEGCATGTLYKLSWRPVKETTQAKQRRGPKGDSPWLKRKISSIWDDTLNSYAESAPSLKPPTQVDTMAQELHSWETGEPPFDLDIEATGPLKYVLPLAQWAHLGFPTLDTDLFDTIFIDEAQDMSALELRSTLALLSPKGKAYAYMDPGQAIFSYAKGIEDSQLAPAWSLAGEHYQLNGGHRIGEPAASLAAQTLQPFFDRPASTFSTGVTNVEEWEHTSPPARGLVLGYSRAVIAKTFETWDLENTGIVPGQGDPEKTLVLSTIHSAKGAEAKDIYLLPWSKMALQRLENRDPRELRTLYVALTRAKENLYIPWNLKARINSI